MACSITLYMFKAGVQRLLFIAALTLKCTRAIASPHAGMEIAVIHSQPTIWSDQHLAETRSLPTIVLSHPQFPLPLLQFNSELRSSHIYVRCIRIWDARKHLSDAGQRSLFVLLNMWIFYFSLETTLADHNRRDVRVNIRFSTPIHDKIWSREVISVETIRMLPASSQPVPVLHSKHNKGYWHEQGSTFTKLVQLGCITGRSHRIH